MKSCTFKNEKIFLDLKGQLGVDQLETDIVSFGGVIERFLSREITCVITNRKDYYSTTQLPDHKDMAVREQSPAPSSNCPPVVAALSRGRALLLRSSSNVATPTMSAAGDPVQFARSWGIRVVDVATVFRAIARLRRKTKPVNAVSEIRSCLQRLSGFYVKSEDEFQRFRPLFHSFTNFPTMNLYSTSERGPFDSPSPPRNAPRRASKQTAEAGSRVALKTPTTVNAEAPLSGEKQQKQRQKSGVAAKAACYCEICDDMYANLSDHLLDTRHQSFSVDAKNFVQLDSLISGLPPLETIVESNPLIVSCVENSAVLSERITNNNLNAVCVVSTGDDLSVKHSNEDALCANVVNVQLCCDDVNADKFRAGHVHELDDLRPKVIIQGEANSHSDEARKLLNSSTPLTLKNSNSVQPNGDTLNLQICGGLRNTDYSNDNALEEQTENTIFLKTAECDSQQSKRIPADHDSLHQDEAVDILLLKRRCDTTQHHFTVENCTAKTYDGALVSNALRTVAVNCDFSDSNDSDASANLRRTCDNVLNGLEQSSEQTSCRAQLINMISEESLLDCISQPAITILTNENVAKTSLTSCLFADKIGCRNEKEKNLGFGNLFHAPSESRFFTCADDAIEGNYSDSGGTVLHCFTLNDEHSQRGNSAMNANLANDGDIPAVLPVSIEPHQMNSIYMNVEAKEYETTLSAKNLVSDFQFVINKNCEDERKCITRTVSSTASADSSGDGRCIPCGVEFSCNSSKTATTSDRISMETFYENVSDASSCVTPRRPIVRPWELPITPEIIKSASSSLIGTHFSAVKEKNVDCQYQSTLLCGGQYFAETCKSSCASDTEVSPGLLNKRTKRDDILLNPEAQIVPAEVNFVMLNIDDETKSLKGVKTARHNVDKCSQKKITRPPSAPSCETKERRLPTQNKVKVTRQKQKKLRPSNDVKQPYAISAEFEDISPLHSFNISAVMPPGNLANAFSRELFQQDTRHNPAMTLWPIEQPLLPVAANQLGFSYSWPSLYPKAGPYYLPSHCITNTCDDEADAYVNLQQSRSFTGNSLHIDASAISPQGFANNEQPFNLSDEFFSRASSSGFAMDYYRSPSKLMEINMVENGTSAILTSLGNKLDNNNDWSFNILNRNMHTVQSVIDLSRTSSLELMSSRSTERDQMLNVQAAIGDDIADATDVDNDITIANSTADTIVNVTHSSAIHSPAPDSKPLQLANDVETDMSNCNISKRIPTQEDALFCDVSKVTTDCDQYLRVLAPEIEEPKTKPPDVRDACQMIPQQDLVPENDNFKPDVYQLRNNTNVSAPDCEIFADCYTPTEPLVVIDDNGVIDPTNILEVLRMLNGDGNLKAGAPMAVVQAQETAAKPVPSTNPLLSKSSDCNAPQFVSQKYSDSFSMNRSADVRPGVVKTDILCDMNYKVQQQDVINKTNSLSCMCKSQTVCLSDENCRVRLHESSGSTYSSNFADSRQSRTEPEFVTIDHDSLSSCLESLDNSSSNGGHFPSHVEYGAHTFTSAMRGMSHEMSCNRNKLSDDCDAKSEMSRITVEYCHRRGDITEMSQTELNCEKLPMFYKWHCVMLSGGLKLKLTKLGRLLS